MTTEMNKDQIEKHIKDIIAERNLPRLIKRVFVTVNNEVSGQEVRVMNWNMLAQALSQGADNFVKCPANAIDWENRKWRVVEEILRYEPTVLCMQEVDQYEFLQAILMKFGYMSIFFPKPDSPCLYSPISYGPDGCAIFYKSSDLTLVQSDSIILRDNEGFDTNQVSIVIKFQTKSGSSFTISATHLKAKTGYEEVRRQQIDYLTKYLIEKHDSPIILCGDFNAPPTEDAYAIVKKSDLDLVSACTHLTADGSEPRYTTWKIRGVGDGMKENCRTIDYVWYSRKGLIAKRVLDVASTEEIGVDRLPSLSYPSDHLSLVCDFVVANTELEKLNSF